MGVSKTNGHIQITLKKQKTSQEPSTSSRALNQNIQDMDVHCTFKIKIESQNSNHGCIRGKWPHPDHYQDAKPKSGTPGVLQNLKLGLKRHECSLYIQSQDRAKIFSMGLSEISDPIQIMIKMWNPSQESPAPFKATNQDFKDMDILCTFKIKTSKIWKMGLWKTSDHKHG